MDYLPTWKVKNGHLNKGKWLGKYCHPMDYGASRLFLLHPPAITNQVVVQLGCPNQMYNLLNYYIGDTPIFSWNHDYVRKDSIQTNYSFDWSWRIAVHCSLNSSNIQTHQCKQPSSTPPANGKERNAQPLAASHSTTSNVLKRMDHLSIWTNTTPPYQLPMDPNSQLDQLVFQASLFSVAVILCCLFFNKRYLW